MACMDEVSAEALSTDCIHNFFTSVVHVEPFVPVIMTLPSELHVKNTFITCIDSRPPSLEDFNEEHLVRSCPASCWASCMSPLSGLRMGLSRGLSMDTADGDEQALLSAMAAVRFQCSRQPEVVSDFCDVPVAPEIGSQECPTAGSKGHGAGVCKPCAFVMKGCSSGKDCPFCHLCETGEKKRRRKEKKQVARKEKEQVASEAELVFAANRWLKSAAASRRYNSKRSS